MAFRRPSLAVTRYKRDPPTQKAASQSLLRIYMKNINLSAITPAELAGKRLDQALATLFAEYSRGQLQRWVVAGQVWVNQQVTTEVRYKVKENDEIMVKADLQEQTEWQAEASDLSVVYADEALIVINKPAGLVVHPAAGNPGSTLVNALLHHYPELAEIPRAGLIHRLDKDTTGLLVVARTLAAYHDLVKQLQERRIHRQYYCIVRGRIISGGTIEAPLGRHPVQRKRRAVVASGKPAITHYRVTERFTHYTGLEVILETGRTHQIRVHLAHIGYPVLGDPVYGGRQFIPAGVSATLEKAIRAWHRQALHAERLELLHPTTKELMQWTAPLPADLAALRQSLLEE
jgi:23S rRNA pseudouridine1911/1915/1917 synthase